MKTGRPVKATDHEKKAIVDRFYIERAGCDPVKMRAHNIYSQLERFASEIRFQTATGKKLTANDFRSEPIKAHIATLAETSCDNSPEKGAPVFQPLDIDALLSKPINVFRQTLMERDQRLEALYVRAAAALEQYEYMQDETARLRRELERQSGEIRSLQNICSQLTVENKNYKKSVEYLRRFIRQHVEPEMAEAHLSEINGHSLPSKRLEAMAHTSISKLISPDRSMRCEVSAAVELNFEALCDYTYKDGDLP